jgi:hypothetical protein
MRAVGLAHRVVANRRAFIERELGIVLPRGRAETWREPKRTARGSTSHSTMPPSLSGSDLHAWPEVYGTAMASFVDFNRRFKPDIVLLNGDGLDGAQISTHSRLGWDKRPSPAEEIEALSTTSTRCARPTPTPATSARGETTTPGSRRTSLPMPRWWRA